MMKLKIILAIVILLISMNIVSATWVVNTSVKSGLTSVVYGTEFVGYDNFTGIGSRWINREGIFRKCNFGGASCNDGFAWNGASWGSWTFGGDYYVGQFGFTGFSDMHRINGSIWEVGYSSSEGGWYSKHYDPYLYGTRWSIDNSMVSGMDTALTCGTGSRGIEIWEQGGELVYVSYCRNDLSGGRWTASGWDNTYTAHLTGLTSTTLIARNRQPTIFEADGTLYMIISYWASLIGYRWSGSTWVSDSGAVTGLTVSGQQQNTESIYLNGALSLIQWGDSPHAITGYSWVHPDLSVDFTAPQDNTSLNPTNFDYNISIVEENSYGILECDLYYGCLEPYYWNSASYFCSNNSMSISGLYDSVYWCNSSLYNETWCDYYSHPTGGWELNAVLPGNGGTIYGVVNCYDEVDSVTSDGFYISAQFSLPCTADSNCSFCEKCVNLTCTDQSSSEDVKGECDTSASCSNDYMISTQTGFCDGAGACNTALSNVSAGDVCVGGSSTDPTAGLNCDTWRDCVDEAQSADEYYVGYVGDGTATCDDTDWQATGSTWDVPFKSWINVTEHAATCSYELIPTSYPEIYAINYVINPTTVIFSWMTNVTADTYISWGNDTSYSMGLWFDAPWVMSHSPPQMSGLTPLTIYYYNLTSCMDAKCTSVTSSFITEPEGVEESSEELASGFSAGYSLTGRGVVWTGIFEYDEGGPDHEYFFVVGKMDFHTDPPEIIERKIGSSALILGPTECISNPVRLQCGREEYDIGVVYFRGGSSAVAMCLNSNTLEIVTSMSFDATNASCKITASDFNEDFWDEIVTPDGILDLNTEDSLGRVLFEDELFGTNVLPIDITADDWPDFIASEIGNTSMWMSFPRPEKLAYGPLAIYKIDGCYVDSYNFLILDIYGSAPGEVYYTVDPGDGTPYYTQSDSYFNFHSYVSADRNYTVEACICLFGGSCVCDTCGVITSGDDTVIESDPSTGWGDWEDEGGTSEVNEEGYLEFSAGIPSAVLHRLSCGSSSAEFNLTMMHVGDSEFDFVIGSSGGTLLDVKFDDSNILVYVDGEWKIIGAFTKDTFHNYFFTIDTLANKYFVDMNGEQIFYGDLWVYPDNLYNIEAFMKYTSGHVEIKSIGGECTGDTIGTVTYSNIELEQDLKEEGFDPTKLDICSPDVNYWTSLREDRFLAVPNMYSYCADKKPDRYCNTDDLINTIKYNPNCFKEALNYCVIFTYPFENGGNPFLEGAEHVSGEGATVCVSTIGIGVFSNNIVVPIVKNLYEIARTNLIPILLLIISLVVVFTIIGVRKRGE